MNVGIIGAGIAGLSAARRLTAAGCKVSLFDKGRGAGGRMSTRRAKTSIGEVRFDHGAQYFTARDEAFRAELAGLQAEGAVKQWRPRLADIRKEAEGWHVAPRADEADRESLFVGTPSMNAMLKALAEGQSILWGWRATGIVFDGNGRWIRFEDGGEAGPFDVVICAVPGEQAADLLAGASPQLAAEAGEARSLPCWAVMLAFDRPVATPWDGARVFGSPLGWIARNASKPGRVRAESWVLHATPEWSAANIDREADSVAAELVGEFRVMTGAMAPVHVAAHRWRYALVERPAGTVFGWDAERQIAAIGDWCTGPRIELAWESGRACAEHLKDAVPAT
ncbi:NAD(P)/FAD-dependent oxidoreductase [Henriciella aquimarina]|uniref:NAD(P)/FAD-dependent oxidoreductase n=1 Tax=Henriciella aquimarina TaxID=545261 RepID=UPI000A0396EC|nr:FAD-dependent oxidoreductase [Henriciella aquimarina]